MLAPLHVGVSNTNDGTDVFDIRVGELGKIYDLRFRDLMRLIQCRQGAEQKRLEYKPHE